MEQPEHPRSEPEPVQPDPALQLSEDGRASGTQITLVAIGCMLIVALMIYGLGRPATTDGNLIASGPPAQEQTTGAAPPAEQPPAQSGGNVAGGDNPEPQKPAQPAAQEQSGQQPVPEKTKPGVVRDDSTR